MKYVLFLLAILPIASFCQQQNTNTDSTSNAFGDTTSLHMLCEKYSSSHQLMVSFTHGSTADLNEFWTYLISELHYKTEVPNTVKLIPANLGLGTVFFKYGDGLSLNIPTLKVNLACSSKGTNLQSAVITGDNDLLTELFVKYFGGTVTSTTPLKGLCTTYTTTDEVKLLPNQIIILPKQTSQVY